MRSVGGDGSWNRRYGKAMMAVAAFIVAQWQLATSQTTSAAVAAATATETTNVDYAATAAAAAAANLTAAAVEDAVRKQRKLNEILKDVYATISKNMGENSRKLNLEDFSWGIFGGSRGRLRGFGHFQLVNNKTTPTAHKRKLNVSFEFTVPKLAAVWDKSVCLGYSCVMTMELDNATFALRATFDADHCVFEHLAYLKSYTDARCFVSYLKTSPIPSRFVQTTVTLLSRVMNTRPFHKIIKDNVDYALLQLPLFDAADVQRICDAYRQISL